MSLKTTDELVRAFKRRYASVWADELCGTKEVAWPYAVRVGKPTRKELEHNTAQLMGELERLAQWASLRGLTTLREQRLVGRVSYALLSHVQASTLDELARVAGTEAHVSCYRERLVVLRERFPRVEPEHLRGALVLMSKCDMSDVDFDLVCRAATWFATHETAHLTARQVPLEGFHAKWLDAGSHRQLVCLLSQRERLELKGRPRQVRFHYLDPSYLSQGGRAYDSWVEGDVCEVAYSPAVVVICENRDSALWFPALREGIAVLGDGMAGTATLGGVPWIFRAPHRYYWGDMDIHGLEILSAYRANGLEVQSVCMDVPTYDTYQSFGTFVDRHGKPLPSKPNAQPLATLTSAENELYLRLCDPSFVGPRRVEQERIPLRVPYERIVAGQVSGAS